ncbi:4Fe-4S dicluster domain-containing protein [Candidatus Woesearchaeota archaeon]|nr:MAG: 4Fe-4S dicluster domain-containing protein [Candidatus Woesearchaeota archaeon]
MAVRKIIEIDEDLCNGCGNCIPSCPEGALQIIDGKARLVSDLFCDGLGACVGECPTGAMEVVEREAQPYDERKVMEQIVKHGKNTIKAHLQHLKDHNETQYLNQAKEFLNEKGIEVELEERSHMHMGCPGSRTLELKVDNDSKKGDVTTQLRQWPVQLHLVNPAAPYFNNADILVCADCVPFAYGAFHQELLKGKALAVGCPKLDDLEAYKQKIKDIIQMNNPKSVTVAIMEVPCCSGMYHAVREAVEETNPDLKVYKRVISIGGEII